MNHPKMKIVIECQVPNWSMSDAVQEQAEVIGKLDEHYKGREGFTLKQVSVTRA